MESSIYQKRAEQLLATAKRGSRTPYQRCEDAIQLAANLLEWANEEQSFSERRLQAQLSRMMHDPNGKCFTTAMTDQCFRSRDSYRVANQLTFLINLYGVPRYLSWYKRIGIHVLKWLGPVLAPVLIPLVRQMLRQETSRVILPGEPESLAEHLTKRAEQGVRVNLNHLGEAILGEAEAEHRLNTYLEDLAKPEVDYISVKISTICSQLNLLAWDDTLEVLTTRLRKLYRAAGTKFVNLDMEEYSDLDLTIALFKKTLSEPEFHHYSAGIVLQAYIPDSFVKQQELTHWAEERVAAGRAPIKIRIVKGANLGMERVISSLHGWPQAPYQEKAEVDTNFKRMVVYGMEHAHAVRLGIGSHNLFDIAYALLLRAEKNLENEVIFEMLEGMADHMRRVVQKISGDILLYCPAAAADEFQNAIAYLIRRLDENTAPQNFLRHAFGLMPGTEAWKQQEELFRISCLDNKDVENNPRRFQDRNSPVLQPPENSVFLNEANTDWALAQNRRWIRKVMASFQEYTEVSFMTLEDLEKVMHISEKTRTQWGATTAQQRSHQLYHVAQVFRQEREAFMHVMMKTCGKTAFEADVELQEAIDFIEYYRRIIVEMHQHNDISWTPKGAVVVAPPWNFPCSIPVGGIAAALAAGNVVLFKPAPEAVHVGRTVAKAFWDGGISKEFLQLLICEDETVGTKLIQDKRVDAVILTGGTETARHLMRLRPGLDLLAETGGKNAIIVTRMADRDLAIRDAVHSAFGHAGQKCSACSLLICEAEVYDDPKFMRQLRDAAASLAVGQSTDLKTSIGPLIRPPAPHLLRGLTMLEAGEEWLLQPQKLDEQLWTPGIKLGVQKGSFTYNTELFGPVLGVMRAKDLQDAISIANGTPYGLTSGLHSLDPREHEIWRVQIEAGNLYINRGITGAVVERQPFGGCKDSSFGPGVKAGGPNYLVNLMYARDSGEDSYQRAWDTYFTKPKDVSQVIGEQNILLYKPVSVILRVQIADSKEDVEKVKKAASICEAPLHVSDRESEEIFLKRVMNTPFVRVRFLSRPSPSLTKALWEMGARVIVRPVLANGRYELLNYLREVALSYSYHRYGNLES